MQEVLNKIEVLNKQIADFNTENMKQIGKRENIEAQLKSELATFNTTYGTNLGLDNIEEIKALYQQELAERNKDAERMEKALELIAQRKYTEVYSLLGIAYAQENLNTGYTVSEEKKNLTTEEKLASVPNFNEVVGVSETVKQEQVQPVKQSLNSIDIPTNLGMQSSVPVQASVAERTPVVPATPVEPVAPVVPTMPTTPVVPTMPTTPVVPTMAEPVEPVTPVMPTVPATPVVPVGVPTGMPVVSPSPVVSTPVTPVMPTVPVGAPSPQPTPQGVGVVGAPPVPDFSSLVNGTPFAVQ